MTRDVPESVVRLLDDAVAATVTPGGVIEAGTAAGPSWLVARGHLTYGADARPVTDDTVYDLASLTKVIATTTLAMQTHGAGTLPLDALVGERLPAFRRHPPIAMRDLLEHAAGFPAHQPHFQRVAGLRGYVARIAAEPLEYAPRARSEYTDLGFIVLGALLEDVAGASLRSQFDGFIAQALGDIDLTFGVRDHWRGRIAPTSVDWWRGRVIAGHVHDSNAAAIGGAAGHAGLFGTAGAVGAFARWLLSLWRGGATPWRDVTSTVVEQFTARGHVPGGSRALGWDTMLPTSSCGRKMSPRAVGHTGFTGTSLWIDPDRGLYVVCLTNRVHPAGAGDGIRALRAALHEAIVDDVDRRSA